MPVLEDEKPATAAATGTRVVVIADYPAARAGLRAMLDGAGEIAVVGESMPGALPPVLDDLAAVVVDVARFDDETADELERTFSGAALVVLAHDEASRVTAARSGVAGRAIVSPDVSAEELASVVAAAAHGFIVLDPAYLPSLREQATVPADDEPYEPLTPRELEVLEGMALGLPNKGIALRLKISEHTVKFHVGTILAKLGAASRTEAVMSAARHGLLRL